MHPALRPLSIWPRRLGPCPHLTCISAALRHESASFRTARPTPAAPQPAASLTCCLERSAPRPRLSDHQPLTCSSTQAAHPSPAAPLRPPTPHLQLHSGRPPLTCSSTQAAHSSPAAPLRPPTPHPQLHSGCPPLTRSSTQAAHPSPAAPRSASAAAPQSACASPHVPEPPYAPPRVQPRQPEQRRGGQQG